MKLTPWMLTVATFCMVGAIAVSYFFKHTARVATDKQPVVARSGWVVPPASIGMQTSPVESQPIDVTVTEPTAPLVTANETYAPGLPEEPQSVDTHVDASLPKDSEPIDPLFGDPNEPENKANETPTESGFITEQFRSIERTDVRFINGEAVSATNVARTGSAN